MAIELSIRVSSLKHWNFLRSPEALLNGVLYPKWSFLKDRYMVLAQKFCKTNIPAHSRSCNIVTGNPFSLEKFMLSSTTLLHQSFLAMITESYSPIGALIIVPIVILLLVVFIALKAGSIWRWIVNCCHRPGNTFHRSRLYRRFKTRNLSSEDTYDGAWSDLETTRSGGSSFLSRASRLNTFMNPSSETHSTTSIWHTPSHQTRSFKSPRSSRYELSNVAKPLPVVFRAQDLETQMNGEWLDPHSMMRVREARQWQQTDP